MPPDFWVDPSMADVKGWFAFNVGRFPGARAQTLARLKPGVDYAQAEAELTTIATSIEAAGPNGADAADWRIRLEPLHDIVTAEYKETLYLLLGAVAFVLLISAVNVANLQLSRSVTRQSEMATRVALGAGRWRLIRQLLTENVLLALIGGVLGIAVAYLGFGCSLRSRPVSIRRRKTSRSDRPCCCSRSVCRCRRDYWPDCSRLCASRARTCRTR